MKESTILTIIAAYTAICYLIITRKFLIHQFKGNYFEKIDYLVWVLAPLSLPLISLFKLWILIRPMDVKYEFGKKKPLKFDRKKIGRNESCPLCKSGKKYKHCHGKR